MSNGAGPAGRTTQQLRRNTVRRWRRRRNVVATPERRKRCVCLRLSHAHKPERAPKPATTKRRWKRSRCRLKLASASNTGGGGALQRRATAYNKRGAIIHALLCAVPLRHAPTVVKSITSCCLGATLHMEHANHQPTESPQLNRVCTRPSDTTFFPKEVVNASVPLFSPPFEASGSQSGIPAPPPVPATIFR